MTVVSLKTGTDPDVLRIGLSDGSLFSLRLSYVQSAYQDPSLYNIDTEISQVHGDNLRFAAACFRCERVALELVARAEQNSYGMRQKLEKRGHSQGCVKMVLSRLTGLEIIDDARFSERWLSGRVNCLNGTPFKLLGGLCGRGISRDTASRAVKSVITPEVEYELIQAFVRKKRLTRDDPYIFKMKLLAEGFSKSAISRLIEETE